MDKEEVSKLHEYFMAKFIEISQQEIALLQASPHLSLDKIKFKSTRELINQLSDNFSNDKTEIEEGAVYAFSVLNVPNILFLGQYGYCIVMWSEKFNSGTELFAYEHLGSSFHSDITGQSQTIDEFKKQLECCFDRIGFEYHTWDILPVNMLETESYKKFISTIIK